MEQNDIKNLAMQTNTETWALLGNASRAPEESDLMIETVYASNYLWKKVGTEINQARGHWLISRVMCNVGEPHLAQRHADLCTHHTSIATDAEPFDRVYALEAQARVAAMKGDTARATDLRAEAEALAATIADPEDRKYVDGDLASEPWFGVGGNE